jgi:hypothetical protein
MRGDTTEIPTVKMMEALSKGEDLSSVPNLVWKDAGGKVHDNGLTYVQEDLDNISVRLRRHDQERHAHHGRDGIAAMVRAGTRSL